ncbi:MAG TPA: hypothetical protein VGH14_08695 [Solirubrobacterales bacterium]
MPLRVALALIAVLAAVAVAGCGGSSGGDQTATVGDQMITLPSGTHGVYAELEAILGQLPYEAWYTKCVVDQVKKNLSPDEAEALAELPEAEREEKATQITSQAGPACEAQHHLPVVDPNASSKELDLLRAGYVTSMKALAESHGASPEQIACVEEGFQELPEQELIAVVNGAKTAREGILLSVFKPCSSKK